LESIWEERVLVRGLETTDQGIEFLSLAKGPVKEAEVAVRYLKCSRLVDCAIEGELYPFNQVKCNGVL
jgi:hypothetical protein